MSETLELIQDRISKLERYSNEMAIYISMSTETVPMEKAKSQRFTINEEVNFLKELVTIFNGKGD